MPLETSAIKRTFRYNGIKLDDPGSTLSPDQVREHFAGIYPELHTAAVEGPALKGGEHVYEFIRSAGTKG